MVFFKEEIAAFNVAYFGEMCAALESESAMQCYCRDTFRRHRGLVPDSDEEALKFIVLDLTHRFMYDRLKKLKWGLMPVPVAILNECAGHILAKVVLFRRPPEEEIIRAEAARRAQYVKCAREAEEASRNAEAEKEAEDIRKAVAKMACFPSVEAILKDIHEKGGRDPFVADLANNYGSTNYDTGSHCWVIYAIICRVDLNIYVGQTNALGERMRAHFSGQSSNPNLTSAMNKYGREKFVSVILLAGIKEKKDLDLAETALIEILVTLPGKTGYNIHHGTTIGPHGVVRYSYRAVVITILDTGSELYFNTYLEAANGMGVNPMFILLLANNNELYKKWKNGQRRPALRWKCKGGKYLNKIFTARFALIAREGRQ